MALIKHAHSQRLLKEAVVLDMGDLAKQAERILQNAQREAEDIRKRAREDAQQLIKNADGRGYTEGFERGHAEGLTAGAQEGAQRALKEHAEQINQTMARWSKALESWEHQRSAMLQEARDEILRFAFEVAKLVVHRTVKADSSIVADQVAAALALLARPSSVKVSIHPEDRSLVEQIIPELVAKFSTAQHATISSDDSIERGGCIVSTEGGRVDATIHTQLQRIIEALMPHDQHPENASRDQSDSP
jgi:flagellar biosynthesis/type III secretory pathway protein FliH